MISREAKALYFAVMQVPMQISAWAYRTFVAPSSYNQTTVKVHLGPGQQGYKPGWINVDANLISARIDVWADLRYRLPFRDNSVDVFYSHHVIEHLPDGLLAFHFSDMYRCLKPGGIIRVGGPNGDEAFRNFLTDNHEWFSDFPDKRSSIGGRLVNFLLCRGEHLTILSRSYLTELLDQAGFHNIAFHMPVTDTSCPELLSDAISGESETTPASPHTLLVEANKPHL